MFHRIFTRHPASVDESYFRHFLHALSFATAMLVGAAACFIHALVPSLCERTGSRIIARLHDRMLVNRVRR